MSQSTTRAPSARALESLTAEVEGDVLTGPMELALYSTDASIFQIHPAVVVCPRTTADVQAALRFAAREGLPVVARGAGSGLAGESLTDGLVLDFSRYQKRLVRVDVPARRATVEMGLVFQRLNDALAEHKLLFGPDPSSGNRATLGGILGNNATGAHSLRYGYASDNLSRIDAVLADGTTASFHADGRLEGGEPSELRQAIAATIPALLSDWAERVETYWPRSHRNRAGYNVRGARNDDGTVNWCKLLAGSEGTLAVFTGAEITLNPAPPVKALVQANFDSLVAMARALPAILASGCCACELMDGVLLGLAREAYGDHPYLPDVAASLIIEHDGETIEQVRRGLDRTVEALRGQGGLVGEPKRIEAAAEQAEVWSIRKRAVPLLFRRRDNLQPVPFIEDVAVNIEKMADYLERLGAILDAEKLPVAHYAHAGAGELHIRPYLDLHRDADRQQMLRVARKTFELAWQCEGTVSGEHGCGLTRTGFLAAQYGPVYELFGLVKKAFDPDNRLNPGKLVTDKGPEELLIKRLRFDTPAQPDLAAEAVLVWGDGELIAEAERCNGCGDCRGLEAASRMCPMFRALGTEAASPRGKVNLARNLLSGRLDKDLRADIAYKMLTDLCLGCKSCHMECPSGVNVPKLVAEARAYYVRQRGLERVECVLANGEWMGKLGSRFGPVANLTLKVPGVRWAMEKAMGVDRRRPMPPFALGTFAPKARRQADAARNGEPAARVAYFIDLFANYHDHSLGQAVLDVLTHNGIDVVVPDQDSAAMPPIDYGDLAGARKVVARNVERLAPLAAEGRRIVCSEPTAALCLAHEWRDVLDSPESKAVAEATVELMALLRELHRQGRLKTDFRRLSLTAGYHAPCHLRALGIGRPALDVLRLVPGVQTVPLAESCCGVAGTNGFQKRNYDRSFLVGRPLLDSIEVAGVKYVLTDCSTCRMQIEQGSGIPTLHPAKILAAAYGYPVKGLPDLYT